MLETAPSPHYTHQMHSSRPPATQQSPHMPLLSPQLAHQHAAQSQRQPSPNYFGYQGDDDNSFSESFQHVKNNWSPPSSTVRSTLAGSPIVVPVDQNPDFDAFRRQSDHHKSFNAEGFNSFKMSIPKQRPHGARTSSGNGANSEVVRPTTEARDVTTPSYRTHLDPSASELSRSPKRALSPLSAMVDSHRRASPASFTASEAANNYSRGSPPESVPRFKLPIETSAMVGSLKPRAETMPETSDSASTVFATPEHVVSLMTSNPDELLLVDLRVYTQYSSAHITSALNLCVPTVLLKRPSASVQTLADMIKDEQQRRRFESWESMAYVVVYDDGSSQLKSSSPCLNLIKKLKTNGYEGTCYIIKGGFTEFSKRYPAHVEQGCDDDTSPDSDGPDTLPVAGGCPMPSTDQPVNPFFGNIRQNMDLIGGVGQIALKHPAQATSAAEKQFPTWLKQASADNDQGKQVSHKFEQIEKREKHRMEDALSSKVSFGTPGPRPKGSVQIAGLEKGNKNRYNNIWPFEHSRVKIQGVPSHGCDYFNASYIKASRSNKSYISTQAPIPATFNDFWNIIWQQDVRVVVMLTAEKEGAQVKAHRYWDQGKYGSLDLQFLSEKRASLELSRIHKHQKRPAAMQRHSTKSTNPHIPLAQIDARDDARSSEQPFVIVRKFTLTNIKLPYEPMREITQLQYPGWPDFGAPAHPAHLLGLVEQCDAVARATDNTRADQPAGPHKRPMLVHCSAGCGRTGTFCTVDSVIDMLKRQRISRTQQASSTDMGRGMPSKSAKQESKDFFGSKTASSSDTAATVDSTWVSGDDLDLVESTVEDFRLQRISMVQSLRQFVLCYESIMEWLVEQELAKER